MLTAFSCFSLLLTLKYRQSGTRAVPNVIKSVSYPIEKQPVIEAFTRMAERDGRTFGSAWVIALEEYMQTKKKSAH
jgi:hypothetical protein